MVVQSGGMTLLAAATRERIQTGETATWTPQAGIAASWTKSLAAVPLSDTHHLLASGSGHALDLWDPITAENLHTLVTTAPIEAITALRNNGTLLLSIGGPAGFTLSMSTSPRPDRPPWGQRQLSQSKGISAVRLPSASGRQLPITASWNQLSGRFAWSQTMIWNAPLLSCTTSLRSWK